MAFFGACEGVSLCDTVVVVVVGGAAAVGATAARFEAEVHSARSENEGACWLAVSTRVSRGGSCAILEGEGDAV